MSRSVRSSVLAAALIADISATAAGDVHTFYKKGQPMIQHMDIDWSVNFETQTVAGIVHITFTKAGKVHLDTRDLNIKQIRNPANGRFVAFTLHAADPEQAFMGQALEFEVPLSCEVVILYKTSPTASGLNWLPAEQVEGGQHPFLFTQAQAVHARSFLPCQDTPAVRFTYNLALEVPPELRGVAAATFVSLEGNGKRNIETWKMDKPIPSYLVAFAVGELEFRQLSHRSQVWAHPSMLDRAAHEFQDIERAMLAAEEIAGPYRWGKFGIIVLPYSFTYGGMENPGLTFVSNTILYGDRSGMAVVIHELAHHWTGNLVTNASWDHFWLNEGPTVWFEDKLVADVYGNRQAALNHAVQFIALREAIQRFDAAGKLELTKLRLRLGSKRGKKVDPDHSFSSVPYQKGARFLQTLEAAVDEEYGTGAFMDFFRAYIEEFAWRSVTTEQFCTFFEERFPGILDRVKYRDWLHKPGMPKSYTPPANPDVERVLGLAKECQPPTTEEATNWVSAHWMLYLGNLVPPNPDDMQADTRFVQLLADLNDQHNLQTHPHLQIRWSFLILQARANWRCNEPAFRAGCRQILYNTGRVFYLARLYKALLSNPATRAWAHELFEELKPRYNSVAVQMLSDLFSS